MQFELHTLQRQHAQHACTALGRKRCQHRELTCACMTLQEYASTSGFEEELGEEAVTKVWVLMGGEGLQRQQSLKSGLHACLMLQNNSELQVRL